MRLLYLDEAGMDSSVPFFVVAGVLIHGDLEWPEVEQRIGALIEKYIPEQDQLGFVFHASDIFHGSKYFDRRKLEWSRERRTALLNELAAIINDLSLPVVFGNYERIKFPILNPESKKENVIHDAAVLDCLIRADKWLDCYAPNELVTVVHEDGSPAKQLIKLSVRYARSADHLKSQGMADGGRLVDLPLKRIVDNVHFSENDARPLQLADLCAFILGRGLKDKPLPQFATEVIYKHLRWVMNK